MYAYFKKLDYFSTECIYSPNAYRGHARTYIKDLEKIRYELNKESALATLLSQGIRHYGHHSLWGEYSKVC